MEHAVGGGAKEQLQSVAANNDQIGILIIRYPDNLPLGRANLNKASGF